MLDSDLNCWLIETNTNPCIEESSKLLEMLLPRMIDDMFKLTIDKVFSKPSKIAQAGNTATNHRKSEPTSIYHN
jgi:hypothetical protein